MYRGSLDSRDMKAAYVVSDENGYYDSQNIISVHDKSLGVPVLSCILHHSRNHEGGEGLTLCSTRSTDGGKTWSRLRPVEEPETEKDCQYYGVERREERPRQSHDGYQLLVEDRIYLFYGWNKGSQPAIGEKISRTDMQLEEGFWMRWSDDFGKTFDSKRTVIPVRRTAVDFDNPWAGVTMGAFCCDKPNIFDGMVFFAFQKTADGNGESYGSEVFLMRSRDLLRLHEEGRPEEASWETLPHGERGLQTPRGLLLGEEPHLVQLAGARLLCFWRTELGCFDYRLSQDYGETWQGGQTPQPLTYTSTFSFHSSLSGLELTAGRKPVQKVRGAVERNTELVEDSASYLQSEEFRKLITDDQNVMRNPRGAFTPIALRDGHVALLYYNNGLTDKMGYVGRLVVWLTLARREEAGLSWAQPEIAIWWDGIQLDNRDDWNEDWAIVDGAGYFDIQEVGEEELVFVESNKLTVRYHTIAKTTVQWLKAQLSLPVSRDAVLSWRRSEQEETRLRAPVLPDLRAGAGFTFVLWLDLDTVDLETPQHLVDGMTRVSGSLDEEDAEDIVKGFRIEVGLNKSIKLIVTDGFGLEFDFELEKFDKDYMKSFYGLVGQARIAFVLDGGPKVASCVLNDKLYNVAPSGWKFFNRDFGEIGGSNVTVCHKSVHRFLIFDRALLTSECIKMD